MTRVSERSQHTCNLQYDGYILFVFELRIKMMTLRRAEVEKAAENQRKLLILANRVEDFAAAVRGSLHAKNFMVKREILWALVRCVDIYPDEILLLVRVKPGADKALGHMKCI